MHLLILLNHLPLPHFTACNAVHVNGLPSYTLLINTLYQNCTHLPFASHTTGRESISTNNVAFGCKVPTPKNIRIVLRSGYWSGKWSHARHRSQAQTRFIGYMRFSCVLCDCGQLSKEYDVLNCTHLQVTKGKVILVTLSMILTLCMYIYTRCKWSKARLSLPHKLIDQLSWLMKTIPRSRAMFSAI